MPAPTISAPKTMPTTEQRAALAANHSRNDSRVHDYLAFDSEGWTVHYEQQPYAPSAVPTLVPRGADAHTSLPPGRPASSAGPTKSLNGDVAQQQPSSQATGRSAGPMTPGSDIRASTAVAASSDTNSPGARLINTLSNVSIASKPNQRSQVKRRCIVRVLGVTDCGVCGVCAHACT
jgi:hypothetical protein